MTELSSLNNAKERYLRKMRPRGCMRGAYTRLKERIGNGMQGLGCCNETTDHNNQLTCTKVQETPFRKSTLYVCRRTPVVETTLLTAEFRWNHGLDRVQDA